MYILFECSECNKLVAYPERFADGHSCDCGGHLLARNKGDRRYLTKTYPDFISFRDRQKKPPIGVMPRWAHELQRIEDLGEAIQRYAKANIHIPFEWINEYNERVKKLSDD